MQREFCRERGRVDLTSHRSAELATSHPDLTRRANHRHSEIIAEIVKPAPDPAAGFLLIEFPQSDGGPHVRTPHLPNASSPGVVVRTSIVRTPFRCATIHAGARERAGTRRGVDATAAAAPSLNGLGSRPK